jgi:aryl-alcohol dehydrogenase-like predicted oxidoreductase
MKYRQLGASPLRVSEIALGSWLTFAGGLERENAEAVVRAALDSGITFFDTANAYGRGKSEEFLGQALAKVPRSSYVLATKLYFAMSEQDRGLSRAQIVKQLDASLLRLKTGHIDLYQCHRYDHDTPLEETMLALTAAVQSGKVRYLGFSEWPVDKIKAATEMANIAHFVSSQPQYSLLHRAPEEQVIPYCKANGISQIVWSPLAQGVLTGKYLPGSPPPADSRATSQAMGVHFVRDWLDPKVLTAVQALKPLAQEAGLSLSQFALAWVLRDQAVASAIIGASRPAQIVENAKASGAAVPATLFKRAEGVIGGALAATRL